MRQNYIFKKTFVWIGCTMVLAIFCGFMLVLSTLTVCVITENSYGKLEVYNKQVALWYSYKDSGQTIKKFVGISNSYIHNTTNKRLIMYSVGYGDDMFNRNRVISIPSQTFMGCKYSPSIYFEEAPTSIYKTKYESSTRWVIDYEENI